MAFSGENLMSRTRTIRYPSSPDSTSTADETGTAIAELDYVDAADGIDNTELLQDEHDALVEIQTELDELLAEVPTAEVLAVEVPAVEVPAVEVPAVEVPAVKVPAVEVPAASPTLALFNGAPSQPEQD